MEEIILEQAIFKFSQDANCLSSEDDYEQLEVIAQSSLGIDRDEDCFYVLKTEKWSVDNADDFKKLFDRIERVILKK